VEMHFLFQIFCTVFSSVSGVEVKESPYSLSLPILPTYLYNTAYLSEVSW
jgi:hypothetical protein